MWEGAHSVVNVHCVACSCLNCGTRLFVVCVSMAETHGDFGRYGRPNQVHRAGQFGRDRQYPNKAIGGFEKLLENFERRFHDGVNWMYATAARADEGSLKMNTENFGREPAGLRRLCWILMAANVVRDSREAAARLFNRCRDRGGHDGCGSMPRNGGGDAVEPAGVGLHYVVPPGAVNVHIHKARHNGHSRRNVVNRARRNANLVPMS